MHVICALALAVCLWASLLQPAAAEETCAPDSGKLGVSRTIAIDTTPGPLFGATYRSATSLLNDGEVVLTFDDGPSRAYTRPILEALAAQCTKATFFMLGQMALADPELVKEVARRGHTIGTHTWSHSNLQQLSHQKAEAEIELGLSAVQQALGKPAAPFFRFPYLRDTAAALGHARERHLAVFSIDIDSRDFEIRNAAHVIERVMRQLQATRKGIILMHDIHASTAKAVPGLLATLKERGFKVVHITPKADAETIAEVDDLVREEVERKRSGPSAHPLAKRSITWPGTTLSLGASFGGSGGAKAAPAAPAAGDEWAAGVWPKLGD